MPTLAKRAVGAILAILGVVLTAVGLWYAGHLGANGTATFSLAAPGSTPVVVPQTVLNRVDEVVTVTAVPRAGGRAWLAAASPSDAGAVIDATRHTTINGVSTRPWQLEATTTGEGETPALAGTDVWRNTSDGEGPVTMRIEQANAPESVIAQAASGELERVDLTWERKSWFVQAVIAALVGLFLVLSGLTLLWSTRRDGPLVPADLKARGEGARSARARAGAPTKESAPTKEPTAGADSATSKEDSA